jgi:ribonuclease P protein component
MFPVVNRITLTSDFYKIKKFGKRIASQSFSISFLKDDSLKESLFSVFVSKVISKKANRRNKIKRIIKHLVIKNRSQLPRNIKVLIFPKLNVINTKNRELELELLNLFDQLKS